MKFEDYPISHEIKKRISALGYKKPTDIQYKAIRPILRGEDVLAIAQTGTGKTAAFAIPILANLQKQIKKGRQRGVKCLVIAPTHELAEQIADVFNSLGKGTKLKTYCLIGGTDQDPQIAKLQDGIDILVATPGRVFDLQAQGHLRLDKIQTLVLDEADHMLALGFIKDVQDLVKRLPKKRQTLFFSATIDEQIKKLAYSLVKNAIRIQISPKDPVSKNVSHAVALVDMDDKRFFLERFLNEHKEEKVLVFVRTGVRAERVVKAMERVNIASSCIHRSLDQEQREQVLHDFRIGHNKVLIATDVTARGLDIPEVNFVINYDLPTEPENYVHRVGRTGRGNNKGQAISFCSKEEKSLLDEIETYIHGAIEELEISKDSYKAVREYSSENVGSELDALMKEIEDFDEINHSKKKSHKAKMNKKRKR